MLVACLPFFVANAKMIPVYNFVAPLKKDYVCKKILIEDIYKKKH